MPTLTQAEAIDRARLLDVTDYALELTLDAERDTFVSVSTIRFRCLEPGASSFVEMRGELGEAVLNGRPLDSSAYADNRIALTELAADNELRVAATMTYSHTGEGMHRFVDAADGEVYLYAQSFLDDAQRVFACFDQPDLKAPLTLTVHAPPRWSVIGNEHGVQTEPGRWEFARTKPIATYLFTVCAGPYHAVYADHDGIRLGLHCRASLAPYLDADTDELFDLIGACFDRSHELYDVRYPFGDTYDHVFAPEFSAGAMENPGCVTLRDDDYLFRSTATTSQRELRAVVIAHEMAHMWFGDLVSPRWWDDLWLNESFAEYAGYRVVTEATDHTNIWATFTGTRKPKGYIQDQTPSTHPVAGEVPDAAHGMLGIDGITYPKGASALRQLAAWLGDDIFLAAIRAHFDRHAYGNATLADLIAAFADAAGRAGATDRALDGWVEAWLRTSQVNTLTPRVEVGSDGHYTRVVVGQSAPPEHPRLRPHRIGVGLYDLDGETLVRRDRVHVDIRPDAETSLAELVGRAAPDLLVLNDGDLTYAKIDFDPDTRANLLELLPRSADPHLRALVWSAVENLVRDGVWRPDDFLELIARALPSEPHPAVQEFNVERYRRFADRFLEPARAPEALGTLAVACRGLATDGTDAERRLVGVRGLARCASGADLDRLSAWLQERDLPEGVPMGSELRWMLLERLVITGRAGADRIAAELDRDRTSAGAIQGVKCHAALPDIAAKEAAWSIAMTDEDRTNREIGAAAGGFWQPEQAALTAAYVDRFFTDVVSADRVHSAWTIAEICRLLYPRYAVEPSTRDAAARLLGRTDLSPALRRAVVDADHEVGLALASRTKWDRVDNT